MQMWSWAPDMHRAAVDGRIKTYYPPACNTCFFLHVCGRALKPGFHPPCEPSMEPPLGPTEPAGLDAPTALADMVAGGFCPGGRAGAGRYAFSTATGADPDGHGRGADHGRRRPPGGGGGHRGGQDLFLSGSGAAQWRAGFAVHGHQGVARPVVRARPARPGADAGPARAHGFAQGPRQLSVPAPHGTGAPGCLGPRAWRGARAGQRAGLVAPHAGGGFGGTDGAGGADWGEVRGLDERWGVLPLVTSTRENCLGTPCPRFRDCHVHRARREALAADMVVINHHLFFADGALRESGLAPLLPTVRVVVFDEAHQINETGVQFLGAQLSTGQLLDFGRDLLMAGLRHARGL